MITARISTARTSRAGMTGARTTLASTSTARHTIIPTPIGPFTIITTDSDLPSVLAAGWTDDPAQLLPVIAPSLRPAATVRAKSIPLITDAAAAYHEGEFAAVDRIAVQQTSGAFLQHAWDILRQVEAGRPVTYAEFAVLAGRPTAVRAAAAACARNAAALFVPCHRVIRTDGSLGGFRWGLPAKRWLLDHEQLQPTQLQPTQLQPTQLEPAPLEPAQLESGQTLN